MNKKISKTTICLEIVLLLLNLPDIAEKCMEKDIETGFECN